MTLLEQVEYHRNRVRSAPDALEKQRRIEELHHFYASLNFEQRMELGPFVERLREEFRQLLQKMEPLASRAEELLARK